MNNHDNYRLKLRYKIIIALISVIVFYSIPELCLRLYIKKNPDKIALLYERIRIESRLFFDIVKEVYLEPDPLLYWKLKSKKEEVAVNSLGCRGSEFSLKKQRGVFRIVCLGDSCTYGACIVNNAETYVKRLEEMLNVNNTSSMRYEVINAGVPGYSSFQALMNLQKRIVYWNPDLITVYIGHNNDYAVNRYYDLEPLIKWPIILKINSFLERSYLFQLLKSYTLEIKLSLLKRIYKDFPAKYRKSMLQVLKEHYLKMAQIAKQNNFKIIFLNYPLCSKDGTLGEKGELNITIKKAAEESAVPLADIVSVLKSRGGEKLFLDDVHPDSMGHKVIAETIFNTIINEDIIPKQQD